MANWIHFKSSDVSADVFQLLREELDRILAERIRNPDGRKFQRDEIAIVDAICRLARSETKYAEELQVLSAEALQGKRPESRVPSAAPSCYVGPWPNGQARGSGHLLLLR